MHKTINRLSFSLLFKVLCFVYSAATVQFTALGSVTRLSDGSITRHVKSLPFPSAIEPRRIRYSIQPSRLTTSLLSMRGGGEFIEINPEYTHTVESREDGVCSEPSDDEETSDDELEEITPKLIFQKQQSKASSSPIKSLCRILHGNQLNAYLLLTIIAFRRDIFQFIIQYNIIPTKIHPDTGRRQLNIKWSTDGLKLLLILQLIRLHVIPTNMKYQGRLNSKPDEHMKNETQTSQPKEDQQIDKEIPILPLLIIGLFIFLILSKHTSILWSHPYLLPIATSFFLRSLQNPNPDSTLSQLLSVVGKGELVIRQAYIPSLEQHYTFEQLNERYYKDWACWRKAFPANDGLRPHHSRHDVKSSKRIPLSKRQNLPSILSSIFHPGNSVTNSESCANTPPTLASTYPREYTNGTVIVLDMTKLDTQATKMESIRDQISFLIHLLENEDVSFFSKNSTEAKGDANDVLIIEDDVGNATLKPTHSLESMTSETNKASSLKSLEVIALLESPGGAVSSYGLAASHLQRLRSTPGVTLTVCIDTVAASGGYMMACMSTPGRLYCAPFAMVGSIGVIGQSLNVQRTLEKYGVRPYVFRGGKMKNPVSMVGDVTKEGVVAMQDMVDRIHEAFRDHVAKAREGALIDALSPAQNNNYFRMSDAHSEIGVMGVIDQVANGDVFLGIQAKKLGLVDRLVTSDEYISERIRDGARVLKLVVNQRPVTLLSSLAGHPLHHRSQQVVNGRKGFYSNLLGVILNQVPE